MQELTKWFVPVFLMILSFSDGNLHVKTTADAVK